MKNFYKLSFLGFVILNLAILLYWKDYWKPEVFFWDENYHIASAAKYLKGIYFMEPHPPLGKLIIAFGEYLLNVNDGNTFGFENFDIIPHEIMSPSFSFAGYRFFPALFSVVNILLFSAILFWITRSYVFTAALSMLPLLDTALLLHSRGAMLEPFLLFGHLLSIFSFLVLLKIPQEKAKLITALTFVMSFAFVFAFMTKIFGLALLVLWPLLYFYRVDLRANFRRLFLGNMLFSVLLSCSIWAVHFEIGKKIQPGLVYNGSYFASDQYERWLLGHEKDSWTHFPQKLYENLRYIFHFEKNVSALNPTDKMSTGSYPITWPLGSLPIIYRWEKNEDLHRYLYLIPNPWAWFLGLSGLLFAIALWIRRGKDFVFSQPEISSLLLLYFAYYAPMHFIKRVLYLYHYFPMLIITWLLLAMILKNLYESYNDTLKKRIALITCILPLLLFQGYFMNRNFVFYQTADCKTLKSKDLIPFWGLRFPTCDIEQSKRQFLKQFNSIEP